MTTTTLPATRPARSLATPTVYGAVVAFAAAPLALRLAEMAGPQTVAANLWLVGVVASAFVLGFWATRTGELDR